jgi:serine/threonine protein kinase
MWDTQVCHDSGNNPKQMLDPENKENLELTIDAVTGAPPSPFDRQKKQDNLIAGNYRLLERIGEGGMSVVYRAVHQHLGREVAIKILHPHLVTNKSSLDRFKQEAKAVSQLHHKSVVTIHDFGLTEDNRPYLVMDLLVGKSLSELIKAKGRIEQEQALPIFLQIAEALAYTHNAGIIHRDLKPSNVLILPPDQVRIVDFGIAKLQTQEGGDTAALTQTGEVFGSPLYMSPEQCKGERLDSRSDIYSMGCLMYEVLTGKPPVNGSNMLEILYRHMNELPKPMQVDGKALKTKLQTIVFKCLAKDPRDRYQSMKELEQALTIYIQQQDGLLDRLKSIFSLYRSRRKRLQTNEKLALTLSFVAMATILVTSGLTVALYITGARSLTPDAIPDWQRTFDPKSGITGSDYYLVQLSKSKLLERLKFHYNDLKSDGGKSRIAGVYSDDNELVQVAINSAKRMMRDGHPGDASELALYANRISLIENGPKSMLTLETMILTAQAYYAAQEYEKAIAAIQDLILDFGTNTEGFRQFPVGVLCTLAGDCYYHLHKYGESRQALKDGLVYFDDRSQPNQSIETWQKESAAFCVSRSGDVEYQLKNYPQAIKFYEQAIERWSDIHSPVLAYNSGLALYKIALAQAMQGDFSNAEKSFEELQKQIQNNRQNQLLVASKTAFSANYIELLKERGDWSDSSRRVLQSGFARWLGQ